MSGLTDADCAAIVRASIDPQRVLAGIDGYEGSAPDVLLTTVDAILATRLEQTRAEVQDAITGMLHPEFGTEWREPDGVIWKASQEAVEAERDAYRKAKQENDERFQLEAAEQRDRAEKAEAERDRLAAAVERVEALLVEGPDSWEGYDTHDIGHAFLAESVTDWTADLRAALSDAGRGAQ